MKQPTVTQYFLGANSKSGFYSLYDHFCAGPDDIMHIIKSGPGTGKSTFMKRIGKAAEELGYDVEYILCSGDPDSLDGVYIPVLHTGWVDGTDPHVLEPNYFGASGDYVNLGQFCNKSLLTEHRPAIEDVTRGYKTCYKKAYVYLSAAGSLADSVTGTLPNDAAAKIRKRAQAKIQKELTGSRIKSAKPVKRFLRAISCKGDYIISSTLESLCDRLCILESHFGLEQLFFEEIIAEVQTQQVSAVICPNPLCPNQTEAVILPEQKLCFISDQAAPEFAGKVRTIHLDTYMEEVSKADYKSREKQIQQLLDISYSHLAQAKALHDELETYYRPALDVDALNEFTLSVIDSLA